MILIENLEIVVGVVAFSCMLIGAIYGFVKLGKQKQIEKIKEWLIYATIEAEKALGEKTGQIKLRLCYDMFVNKFKYMALLITFDEFSELVDEALEKVRNMLESNDKIQEYVGGNK